MSATTSALRAVMSWQTVIVLLLFLLASPAFALVAFFLVGAVLGWSNPVPAMAELLGSVGRFSIILFYRVSAFPALLSGVAIAFLMQLPLTRVHYLAGAFASGAVVSAAVLSARIVLRGDRIDSMILLLCALSAGLASLFCAVLLQTFRRKSAEVPV